MIILAFWVASLAMSLAFCVATVIVARALGGRVRIAAIFLGPPIVRLSVAGVPAQIGAIPLPLGYVAFERSNPDDEPERTQLHDLSRARRVAILALPWMAIALACVAILGPELGSGAIGRGFAQIVLGALRPNETGRALIARSVELADTLPLHVLGALVVTKLVAFNLLPLPGLAGLAIPTELLRRGSRVRTPRWLEVGGRLAMLAIGVLWAWAVVAYWLGLP